MASGSLVVFDEYWQDVSNGVHNWSSDTFKIALINNTVVPTRDTATPRLADFTEVSGTNYTAGGETLTMTTDESSDVNRFRHTGGTITWAQSGTGPTDIYYAIIYNDTATNDEACAFIDMTADNGTTPLSMVDGPVTWTPESVASRLFTLAAA